jgi:hypothetical protein
MNPVIDPAGARARAWCGKNSNDTAANMLQANTFDLKKFTLIRVHHPF